MPTLRRFLDAAADRRDYPQMKKYTPLMTDGDVRALTKEVLLARKGAAHAYGEVLIDNCEGIGDLPTTLRDVLEKIHRALTDPVKDGEGGVEANLTAAGPDEGG